MLNLVLYLFIQDDSITASQIILAVFVVVMFCIILRFFIKMLETAYVLRYMKPWYTHFYFITRKLTNSQKSILRKKFKFYNRLSEKHKAYFEHRVASFIKDKDFIGREGFKITEEVKIMVSASAVMLTFGFRDYYISVISKIVIYPKAFFSNTNQVFHKGEFNPMLNALVLSWEDFKEGLDIENDNVNLGIHELTHAIHINSMKERDISSTIFSDSFKELTQLLIDKPELREELVQSD